MQNELIKLQNEIVNVEAEQGDTYVFVHIFEDVYSINCKNVFEVLKLVELIRPEKMPAHIAGLFEYNGEIIPIVDIRSVLRLEKTPYDINSRIAIVNSNDCTFGIIVNKVLDIKKINPENIQKAPYLTESNFINEIYTTDIFQCAILNIASICEWMKKNHSEEDVSSDELLPTDSKSVEILHKRKMEYIEKSKTPYLMIGDKDEFVTFCAGGNNYCLKMNDIRGFYKMQNEKLTKVPCTPSFILGLINIKGEFISVIDVQNYFHSQVGGQKENGTVIILNDPEFKIGILAESINDNIQIKPEEIRGLNKQDSKGELSQYVNDGDIYLIINVPEMLTNDKLFIR